MAQPWLQWRRRRWDRVVCCITGVVRYILVTGEAMFFAGGAWPSAILSARRVEERSAVPTKKFYEAGALNFEQASPRMLRLTILLSLSCLAGSLLTTLTLPRMGGVLRERFSTSRSEARTIRRKLGGSLFGAPTPEVSSYAPPPVFMEPLPKGPMKPLGRPTLSPPSDEGVEMQAAVHKPRPDGKMHPAEGRISLLERASISFFHLLLYHGRSRPALPRGRGPFAADGLIAAHDSCDAA